MLFFRKQAQDTDTACSLRERGTAVAQSVGDAFSRGSAHVATLAALFKVEAAIWGGRALRKTCLLLVGAFLVVVAYAFTVVVGCLLLAESIGWLWTLTAVAAFHAVAGLAVICGAVKMKTGEIAPGTVQEIKNDIQCLRILLKDSDKNS